MIISTAIAFVAGFIGGALGFTSTVAIGVATAIGYLGAIAIYGGIALSATSKPKGQVSSASYQGVLQTQTDQNLPVPLLYGTCKLAGNRIWQDENGQTTVRRIVAFAEGEICEYSDIKLNDIPINEIGGISIGRYYGTKDQIIDPIIAGAGQAERAEKVGSLKNVAYLAITVPRSQKIDINYNLTAIVKGRKIRVYETLRTYKVEYSENPAWVMFDFLTAYNGLGLCLNNYGSVSDSLVSEMFDLNSFVESAKYCDELIESKKKNADGTETIEKKPRFTFNMIFDAQTSARNLIDEIYRSCRGGLFIKDGKLQFKIDKAEPVSKVFTEHDIIKGSETFQTIPKEEHYDILKCSYVSPSHEWQKVEATAEVPVYREGVPIEHSVNIYSCTSFEQASRLAWYYTNSKVLQPYFGSFQTDYKGWDLEVGDVIFIDSLLMGLEKYKVKVTSVIDNGAGVYTINWRNYDARLYTDELGSKEPTMLVSNLDDFMTYPDDVQNFNVVQNNNLFSFVWETNSNIKDTYEIRMGESWENGYVLASDLDENKFAFEIPKSGLFKFWIKAYNRYNYSKNASLDILSIDSVPLVNEIVKFDILENLSGTYDENIKLYQNTIKLKEQDVLWQSTQDTWLNTSGFYQTLERWGVTTANEGVYESQVFDTGALLNCIVSFDYSCIAADPKSSVFIEWAYSQDGVSYESWKPINTGTCTLRYCKFKITLKSVNNIQTVLTTLVAKVDVPDKDLDMELEITDPQGLTIEYSFTKPPSIVATVNDDNNAYVVIAEKTETNALIKAYTNSGELTTCKLSLRAKGY